VDRLSADQRSLQHAPGQADQPAADDPEGNGSENFQTGLGGVGGGDVCVTLDLWSISSP